MKKYEVQWLTEKDKQIEETVTNMIEFMVRSKVDVIKFFIDYSNKGLMVQAYDKFEWFEVTGQEAHWDGGEFHLD